MIKAWLLSFILLIPGPRFENPPPEIVSGELTFQSKIVCKSFARAARKDSNFIWVGYCEEEVDETP